MSIIFGECADMRLITIGWPLLLSFVEGLSDLANQSVKPRFEVVIFVGRLVRAIKENARMNLKHGGNFFERLNACSPGPEGDMDGALSGADFPGETAECDLPDLAEVADNSEVCHLIAP